MSSVFYHIYKWGEKNKVIFFILSILFVVLTAYGALNIKFEEDITRILPKNEKTSITSKILGQLRFSDKVSVIIEKQKDGTTDDMVELANQFLDSLAVKNEYVKSIQGKVDDENINEAISFVYDHLPLFLEETDYDKIATKLNNDSLRQVVEGNYKTLISPTGMVAKQFIQRDPMGIGFMALQKLQQLNIGDDFHLVDGYIMNKDEDKLLLFIDPVYDGTETEHNTIFVNYLNGVKEDLNKTYLDKVSVDYFGASFVAVANAKQIKSDIQKTVAISVTVLMLLLIAFYRKLFIPIILFIPTVFAALVALFVLYFIKDSISAISLSVGAILIGITIDYALHIMTHYKHSGDIKEVYREITRPIIMSCATTAIAFLCLVFVHSEALKDLGIFASITVMTAGIFSLLFIPHLYKPSAKDLVGESSTVLDKVAKYPFDKSKWLLGLCLLAIVVSCFTFNHTTFNKDLSSMNYFPEELKQAEEKLNNTLDSNSKSLYITCYGENVDEVVEDNARLAQHLQLEQSEGNILQYSSLGNIVLSKSQQEQKIKRWNEFWAKQDITALKNTLISEGLKYDFMESTYTGFYNLLATSFSVIPIQEYVKLNPQIMDEFFIEKDGFYTINTLVKVKESDRATFVNALKGPKEYLVIDRKAINETFLSNLVNDFTSLVNYSFIAVLLILWFFFRRAEMVIVSMIPIMITGFITTGLMGLFQIEFNIFSSIVCTLVFGQGVDFTIFMTNSLQKEYTTGKDESVMYRSSIILAVLTTLLAIGTLIFAKHPALRSISMVSLIGLSVSAIVAFVLYPRLYRFCFTNRQRKGLSPITLRLTLFSVVSFTYFGLFGILYSCIARVLMLILPMPKVVKLRWFGKGMSLYQTSVLYLNPFVKKGIINKHKEDFKKPAIIIANHTSFLDSLTIGMVNSNIVYLVNDWVYKSPIFGRAVQMAGFYPVSNGVDNSVAHLEERVKQGFSLMIFPEGTRSMTNDVQRFHKGAFFLAETLKLDILPMYIHGNSEVIPKGDYVIYGGHIITTVGERIAYDDSSYGSNYAERTKKISRFFKEQFKEIRTELEDKNYFRRKLLLSYYYKEGNILKEVKEDFKQYADDYYELNNHLSDKEKIVHLGDDYGQINFLVTLQQSKRKVYAYLSDSYKRSVAQTNYVTKCRSVVYVEDIDAVDSSVTTLLVSAAVEHSVGEHINKIVVLRRKANGYEPEQGFDLAVENEYISVYLRK
ncbi:1-acyl-sn-glycerol-3-phosphate acyltransferase [Myroides marinus]|uniref:1-acyl-sn-glycerol-3-phosphate acyltransferase n=1 Tax=Myroides marinus TaxID=703342 RepID=UPI0025759417|nr:1-acyl-sn-glycerol-3-phosphate acyltransferase [Myroides marinus]MDM1367473.1 1-acyl-sn-glycerol-3-phosphate acyltransferase [Myroides marinus]MDM1370935.1 1-acyl-sn-glycerol-3-phosphate acyltransferase [Myroides marinus]MDM1373972.1 1-acyl-sn-glycerol-3-phosphate acyltransferase [Myroides marinus]MDM1382994.1 1-acyl-sn-glycerol-3-phosphate acyltransferase [Myroides marinus]MDM1388445.1 1-acyl-sn-glycerol-3-phosphate acyltransferase [Myroides marinus]